MVIYLLFSLGFFLTYLIQLVYINIKTKEANLKGLTPTIPWFLYPILIVLSVIPVLNVYTAYQLVFKFNDIYEVLKLYSDTVE